MHQSFYWLIYFRYVRQESHFTKTYQSWFFFSSAESINRFYDARQCFPHKIVINQLILVKIFSSYIYDKWNIWISAYLVIWYTTQGFFLIGIKHIHYNTKSYGRAIGKGNSRWNHHTLNYISCPLISCQQVWTTFRLLWVQTEHDSGIWLALSYSVMRVARIRWKTLPLTMNRLVANHESLMLMTRCVCGKSHPHSM